MLTKVHYMEPMTPDADVWAKANGATRRGCESEWRYGDDAMLEAAGHADQVLEQGDMAGASVWHRILNAIERLQDEAGRRRKHAVRAEQLSAVEWLAIVRRAGQ